MSMAVSRPTPQLTLHGERIGDKTAVVDDRPEGRGARPGACPPVGRVTVWTFAELNRQANRLGNALLALGVRPGDTMVWCGQNSPGVVRASHARTKIGVTAVPLNYRLTDDEAAYVVDDSDAVSVYADAEMAPLFARIRERIPKVRHVIVYDGAPGPGMLDGDRLVAEASDAEPPAPERDYPAVMFYTSGTTGRPKGAVRPPTNPEQVLPLLKLVGHSPDDVYLTTGPLYHSGPGGYFGIAHLLGTWPATRRPGP